MKFTVERDAGELTPEELLDAYTNAKVDEIDPLKAELLKRMGVKPEKKEAASGAAFGRLGKQ